MLQDKRRRTNNLNIVQRGSLASVFFMKVLVTITFCGICIKGCESIALTSKQKMIFTSHVSLCKMFPKMGKYESEKTPYLDISYEQTSFLKIKEIQPD